MFQIEGTDYSVCVCVEEGDEVSVIETNMNDAEVSFIYHNMALQNEQQEFCKYFSHKAIASK